MAFVPTQDVVEGTSSFAHQNTKTYLEMDTHDSVQYESSVEGEDCVFDKTKCNGGAQYEDDKFNTNGLTTWYFKPKVRPSSSEFCSIYMRRNTPDEITTLHFPIEHVVAVVRRLTTLLACSTTNLSTKDKWWLYKVWDLLPVEEMKDYPNITMANDIITMKTDNCLVFRFGVGAVQSLVAKFCDFYITNRSYITHKQNQKEKMTQQRLEAYDKLVESLREKVASYEKQQPTPSAKPLDNSQDICPELFKDMLKEVYSSRRYSYDDGGRRFRQKARGKAEQWIGIAKNPLVLLEAPKPGGCGCRVCCCLRSYRSSTPTNQVCKPPIFIKGRNPAVPPPKVIPDGVCEHLIDTLIKLQVDRDCASNDEWCPHYTGEEFVPEAIAWTEASKRGLLPSSCLDVNECQCRVCYFLRNFYYGCQPYGKIDPPERYVLADADGLCPNLIDSLHLIKIMGKEDECDDGGRWEQQVIRQRARDWTQAAEKNLENISPKEDCCNCKSCLYYYRCREYHNILGYHAPTTNGLVFPYKRARIDDSPDSGDDVITPA